MSDLDTWMQGMVLLGGDLMISGILRWLYEHNRIPEWVGQVGIGAVGLLAGVLYWLRLTPDRNHSPLLLTPFVMLTLWLIFDLHSRHRTHKRIRDLENKNSMTSPASPNTDSKLPLPATGFSSSRTALPGSLSPDFQDPGGIKVTPKNIRSLGVALHARSMTMHSPAGPNDVDGLGIIRSVEIKFVRDPDRFICECTVDFHQLGDAVEASPEELRLTGPGGIPDLAPSLFIDNRPVGCGTAVYRGECHTKEIWENIRKTVNRQDNFNLTERGLYCSVEIRVALSSLSAHKKSKVALGYERIAWSAPEKAAHAVIVPVFYHPLAEIGHKVLQLTEAIYPKGQKPPQ